MKSENRLKKRKHFSYIYKNGDSRFSEFVQLVFIKSKIKPYKIGLSVSKKIGKSVIRNQVRRRMRESLTDFSNNINPNYNYIFVAREGIEKLDFQAIKQEIKKVLSKANLYDEKNI